MIADMKHYYVYAILRPDKPGPYTYGQYEFTHLPFYVGKGTDDRIKNTIRICNCNKKSHKRNILFFLKQNNMDPIVIIIKDNIDEQTAFKMERSIIQIIGRGKNGPLVNSTDGGEGSAGHKQKNKQKPIYTFDLDGNFLYEFESTYFASSILNIPPSLISRCAYNRKHKAGGTTYSTHGYIFKFKSEFKEKPKSIDVSYLNDKKGNGPIPQKIKQFDLSGNLLNVFDSIKQAAKQTGCRESKICMCCKNKMRTHKKYKWQYYEH